MPAIENHPILPPIDGSLLWPDTLAFHEKHNADQAFYVWKEDDAKEITELTYGEFVKAARRAPHLLDPRIDISSRPVVAIVALADTLVYQTVVTGMISAGVVPFPISPRNTAAAIAHLMKKTSSHSIVTTYTTLRDLMDSVKEEFKNNDPNYEINITEIPTLYQLFPQFSDSPIADEIDTFVNSYQVVAKPEDIALYLHSSGSTGMPKPIPKSHRILIDHVSTPLCEDFRRERHPRLRTPTMHLPPFHAMGFILQNLLPLFSCAVVATFPPIVKRPTIVPQTPSPDAILDHIRRTDSNAILILPTYLQTWANDKEAIDTLRNMEFVYYSGGAISPSVSQEMRSNGVKLASCYGSTEFASIALSDTTSKNEEDWDYLDFSPRYNIRWVPQGDGTYECQVISNDALHMDVTNLPDVEGYATKDLFKPHPTNSRLWKLVGRVDDVIIHSSGEKTVPPPMEHIMLNSPDIVGAVMFGHAHVQAGVLIEPAPQYQIDVSDMHQVAEYRNIIWPIIEEANNVAPAFSKIFKELILIADPNKPLPRAAKGTVMRKQALQVYADEIEDLFATVESVQATETIEPPRAWTQQYVTQWILDQAHDLGLSKTFDNSKNLFEQGFDSLNATILRRRITGAINSVNTEAGRAALQHIQQNLIYSYPTVDSLATHLVELVNADPANIGLSSGKSPVAIIEEMIEKYSFKTPLESQVGGKFGGKEVVLMTGSTGYTGSEVLERLLLNPRISMVYALNRPSADKVSIAKRHWQRFHDKNLNEELLKSPKLKHLECDYSQDKLGLPDSVYAELQKSITSVIHIAWRLDFNLSLASFESHVRGTHNLATLGRTSVHGSKVKFIFTSSIGTAQSWDISLGPYPEEVMMDARWTVGNGYGEGKYVTERVLATSGLNATSLRVGQITGSRTSGAWATSDWVPIITKSSVALGALPTADGMISFIPMDAVTDCIVELVLHDKQYPPALNVVHPNLIEWNTMVKHMQAALKSTRGVSLDLVPYQDWFAKISARTSSATVKDMAEIPAIKLHDFFEALGKGKLDTSSPNAQAFGVAEFATAKMQSINKSMTTLAPLNQDDVDKWIAYWVAAGLFD
ncbi:acetyl-CoA synthetase-like protein [Pholiota conissans]|uniref:Acetyl-CoA synthetase-like protein n=1 Tax=Pholiota conissans TaxID=109636 RepID=A0A9P6D178_9AGAR|nr:acetyl-CoA synthetase-like protein [Pholiota conissans]